jgi:hypothetical protein
MNTVRAMVEANRLRSSSAPIKGSSKENARRCRVPFEAADAAVGRLRSRATDRRGAPNNGNRSTALLLTDSV